MDFTLITENQNDPEVESNPILGLYRYKNENWNRNTKEKKFIIHMDKKKNRTHGYQCRLISTYHPETGQRAWTGVWVLQRIPPCRNPDEGREETARFLMGLDGWLRILNASFFLSLSQFFFLLLLKLNLGLDSWVMYGEKGRVEKQGGVRNRAIHWFMRTWDVLFLCRFAPPIRHSRLF